MRELLWGGRLRELISDFFCNYFGTFDYWLLNREWPLNVRSTVIKFSVYLVLSNQSLYRWKPWMS